MNPELQEAWDDFKKSRKEIKYPLTSTAIKKLRKKLSILSFNNEQLAIAILNQSSECGYRGLFPLNKQNQEMYEAAERARRKRETIQCQYCFLNITEATKQRHESNECTMAPRPDPVRAQGMIDELMMKMGKN